MLDIWDSGMHDGGWGWVVGGLMMLLIWGAVIWGAVYVYRRSDTAPHGAAAVPNAEAILRDRFARGEIEREEYEERLSVLRRTEQG